MSTAWEGKFHYLCVMCHLETTLQKARRSCPNFCSQGWIPRVPFSDLAGKPGGGGGRDIIWTHCLCTVEYWWERSLVCRPLEYLLLKKATSRRRAKCQAEVEYCYREWHKGSVGGRSQHEVLLHTELHVWNLWMPDNGTSIKASGCTLVEQ